MSDSCETCGAPFVWALTPAGKAAPIDRDPLPNGNVLLLSPTGLASPLAVVLTGRALEEAKKNHLKLRLNHWATCPDRERWKAKQKEQGETG